MRRFGSTVVPFLLITAMSLSCSSTSTDAGPATTVPPDPPATSTHREDEETSEEEVVPTTLDCTDLSACPEIGIGGDPPATLPGGSPSPLRGYADPSVRYDPDSDRLWMAYSWPSMHIDGTQRVSRIETHLAESTNGGASWDLVQPLWVAEPATDPATGGSGFTDHEVANLARQEAPDGVRWIGARLDLFVPAGGGLGVRPPNSFRIVVSAAASPPELANAPSVTLGAAATHPGWDVSLDLTKLDDEVAGCAMWNEPALLAEPEVVYLAVRCLRFEPATRSPDWDTSELFVFRAQTAGAVGDWTWTYRGRLAGRAEAVELGGDGLTQIDLAYARDGTLVALLTPDGWDADSRDFVHHGLRVVEVASLATPSLARRADGSLAVRAVISADDGPLGSGASTYDPELAAGIIFVRRSITEASLVGSMHGTGVHP